jgi:ribosomal protein S27AE
MDWTQLGTESAFLLLSIFSATGAAAVLLRCVVGSRMRRTSSTSMELSHMAGSRWSPSLLDRVSLLNRNLTQCPNCFMIDHANIRFCSRCGMDIHAPTALSRTDIQNVEVQHIRQDESTQVIGVSMDIDPKTRIGVIIGVQDREPADSVSEAQVQAQKRNEHNLYS